MGNMRVWWRFWTTQKSSLGSYVSPACWPSSRQQSRICVTCGQHARVGAALPPVERRRAQTTASSQQVAGWRRLRMSSQPAGPACAPGSVPPARSAVQSVQRVQHCPTERRTAATTQSSRLAGQLQAMLSCQQPGLARFLGMRANPVAAVQDLRHLHGGQTAQAAHWLPIAPPSARQPPACPVLAAGEACSSTPRHTAHEHRAADLCRKARTSWPATTGSRSGCAATRLSAAQAGQVARLLCTWRRTWQPAGRLSWKLVTMRCTAALARQGAACQSRPWRRAPHAAQSRASSSSQRQGAAVTHVQPHRQG